VEPQPVDEISAEPRAIPAWTPWVTAVVLLAAALAAAITVAVHYRGQAAALRRHLYSVRAPVAPPSAATPKLSSRTTALPASGTLAGDVTVVTARFSARLAEVVVTARISGGRPHSSYALFGGDCAGNAADHTWAAGRTDARGSADLTGRAWKVSVSDQYYLALASPGMYQTHPGPAVHGYIGLAHGLFAVPDGSEPCAPSPG
jgi:hypothetical protein